MPLPFERVFQHLLVVLVLLTWAGVAVEKVEASDASTKYSPLDQINRNNVANLEEAWRYHTGDMPEEGKFTSFQDQPSLIDGNLIVCTVNRRLVALDPATGKERWAYDHKGTQAFSRKCRGVAHWIDASAPEGSFCRSRILLGTPDNRLVAVDARTGKACTDFGDNGEVRVPVDRPLQSPGEMMISSRPAVVNDVVVVGSFVADNQRVDAPSGRVMAYHARTGKFLWAFDPIPRSPDDRAISTWENGTDGHGAANVWTDMAADNELDLVYLPTSSPAVDFYGGDRPGDNLYSTSIVALRGATGEVAWHQQLVRHNVFDYDLPSQPMLLDFPHRGTLVPALVQHTKMGLVFVFDRETGEPLVPIVERPVPQAGKVAGEALSPTQPFPEGMPALMPQGFSPDDAWGFTPVDEWLCRRKIEQYNYGPMYTPPSEQGTIFSPAPSGGPDWGTGGYDPDSKIMVVPSNRVPMVVTLIKNDPASAEPAPGNQAIETRGAMVFPNTGVPYKVKLEPLLSPLGAPCSPPPWAALTAVDMEQRRILWEVPLGDIRKLAPPRYPGNWELPARGRWSPQVDWCSSAIRSTMLSVRWNLHTGKVLWETALPAAATSIPVTYEANGEQYVVMPAGGHSMYGSTMGDAVIAYKLRR